MNPKKIKHLLPEFAIQNKEDMALLQKLSEFYWNTVRETLSSTEHLKVKVINLGVFTRKTWNVDKKIVKLENTLRALENSNRTIVKENIQKDLNHLYRVKAFQQTEKDRQAIAKLRRNEYNKTLEKS